MLPRADITGTRPLGPVDAPTPTTSIADARQETFNRLTQIAIGKQFQAEILSRLNDGTFLVKIADTVARMNLPASTRPGESLPMTLVSKEPRPTFLLGPQAGGSSAGATAQLVDRFLPGAPEESLLYTAAGSKAAPADGLSATVVGAGIPEDGIPAPTVAKLLQAALPVAETAQPPAPQAGSAPTSLSTAGRLINTILQSAQQQAAPGAVVSPTPLVPSPAAGTPQVATALKDSLVFSGLFYESHVAQWARGERPMADLQREPQAKAAQLMHANPTLPLAQPDEARPLPNAAQTPAAASLPGESDHTKLPPSMNTESAQLINLQLGALENRRVLWQGELWPGQPLEWEVSEDAPDRDAEDAQPTWNSAVRFELPILGLVSATIRMVGEHVHVQVRTETEAAAVMLRLNGGALASALDAAGSPLDSLSVKQDGKA